MQASIGPLNDRRAINFVPMCTRISILSTEGRQRAEESAACRRAALDRQCKRLLAARALLTNGSSSDILLA